jgi:hypothetical protein
MTIPTSSHPKFLVITEMICKLLLISKLCTYIGHQIIYTKYEFIY